MKVIVRVGRDVDVGSFTSSMSVDKICSVREGILIRVVASVFIL